MEAGRSLATYFDRPVDSLERVFGQHAVVTETLDFEQPSIGGKADFAQLRQIVQLSADAEVVSVVDGGLGTQGAVFLVILLEPRVLVVDVQRGGDVLGDDPGTELSRSPAADGAIEDQLHLLWAAQVEVLADHLL